MIIILTVSICSSVQDSLGSSRDSNRVSDVDIRAMDALLCEGVIVVRV